MLRSPSSGCQLGGAVLGVPLLVRALIPPWKPHSQDLLDLITSDRPHLQIQSHWFSNILVLEQFGSRLCCLWEKCLRRLTKLQVSILYVTTHSCWYLCDSALRWQRRWSFRTNCFSNRCLEWIRFGNRGSTLPSHSGLGSIHDSFLRSLIGCLSLACAPTGDPTGQGRTTLCWLL